MKLKAPAIYSQRDPQWASKILGYNTDPKYNIGMYGCLITCLGMYVGETPDAVNNTLIQSGGFDAGSGNFIWSKSSLLNLNQQVLSYRWGDLVTDAGIQQAQSLLDQGYPLLCEIDFNPATTGEEMHYVLCIGYDGEVFYIADPWTGQITTFDPYGGFRRAVIQFRTYDKKLSQDTNPESLPSTILAQSDAFIALCTKLGVSVPTKDNAMAKIDGLNQQITTLEDSGQALDRTNKDLSNQINDLKGQVQVVQDNNKTLQDNYNAAQLSLKSDEAKMQGLSDQITALETQLGQHGWGAWDYIIAGIKKLIGRK